MSFPLRIYATFNSVICNQILRFGVSYWRSAAFSIIIAQQSVGADLSYDQ